MDQLCSFQIQYQLMAQFFGQQDHLSNGLILKITQCHQKREFTVDGEGSVDSISMENEVPIKINNSSNIAVQTEEPWVSGIDMFAMAAELHMLREKEKQYKDTICKLETEIKELKDQQKSENQKLTFGVDEVLRREGKLKNIFKYYTGIVYIRFASLLAFLVSDGSSINYERVAKTLGNCHCKMDCFQLYVD
ncbi:uncharacterized protein LOC133198074 [Saccostrea echinata]|uniref:uncharacterized protein LOC133198074 n=1 Tax=Saccostrea echinata TaxID=191078 RepID=UPI002A836149|nr:uncharacterized protein LOC133198074 [Saccostrea echinata]